MGEADVVRGAPLHSISSKYGLEQLMGFDSRVRIPLCGRDFLALQRG
jgi:hypothetical protein